MRCEVASAAFDSASETIEARLKARQTPTDEEWRAEEIARAMLVAARRELRAALESAESTRGAAPVAPSAARNDTAE